MSVQEGGVRLMENRRKVLEVKNLKKYYCNFLTGAVAEILLHYVIDDQSWSRQESIENISVILQTSVLGLLAKKGTAR